MQVDKKFDSVQADASGNIWVKQTVTVHDGATLVSSSVLRTSYAPGEELPPDIPSLVTAISRAVWTPEVVAAFRESQETEQKAEE